jgi:hypothetical protein
MTLMRHLKSYLSIGRGSRMNNLAFFLWLVGNQTYGADYLCKSSQQGLPAITVRWTETSSTTAKVQLDIRSNNGNVSYRFDDMVIDRPDQNTVRGFYKEDMDEGYIEIGRGDYIGLVRQVDGMYVRMRCQ